MLVGVNVCVCARARAAGVRCVMGALRTRRRVDSKLSAQNIITIFIKITNYYCYYYYYYYYYYCARSKRSQQVLRATAAAG